MRLAVEPIAAVRADVACSAAAFVDHTCADDFRKMAEDGSHIVRQAAARICRNVALERRVECLEIVVALAKDRVPNVRVHAAEALANAARNYPDNKEIGALLNEMKKDEDSDIRRAVM